MIDEKGHAVLAKISAKKLSVPQATEISKHLQYKQTNFSGYYPFKTVYYLYRCHHGI